LFAIFLLERRAGPISSANHYVLPAGLIAGLTAITILGAVQSESFTNRELRPPPLELAPDADGPGGWYAYQDPQTRASAEQPASNVKRTGFYFLTYYLLPFELTSLVLVVAMVGAIIIARREKGWVAAGRMPGTAGSQESGAGPQASGIAAAAEDGEEARG